jgi:hypothetical protein
MTPLAMQFAIQPVKTGKNLVEKSSLNEKSLEVYT